MQSFSVMKIALGIRMYPGLKAKELSKEINVSLRNLYALYAEADMYSRSWLPNLVTKEQLRELSGSALTVLYYLYTAEKGRKREYHIYELKMSERTFRKALRQLRDHKLIEEGTMGKISTFNITPLSPAVLPMHIN